ncbi:hypothetical protein PY546_04550 [Providencia stuartii]|nr:hypothetical protein [Providencia stuartii]
MSMSKSPINPEAWQPWQLRELNQWDLNASGVSSPEELPEPTKPAVPCLEPQEVLEQINILDNLKEEAQRTGFQQGYELGKKRRLSSWF